MILDYMLKTMIHIIGSTIDIYFGCVGGRDLQDHLMSMRVLTKIFMRALQITRKVATTSI